MDEGPFSVLPTDVVVLVLSRVTRGCVCKIIRVCRLWNTIVLSGHAFWRHLVQARALEAVSSNSSLPLHIRKRRSEIYGTFNYLLTTPLTARQQYGWIFKKEWNTHSKTSTSIFQWLDSKPAVVMQYGFKERSAELLYISLYEACKDCTTSVGGRIETISFTTAPAMIMHDIRYMRYNYKTCNYEAIEKSTPTIIWERTDRGVYSGQAQYVAELLPNVRTEAHGNGRWELNDGRIIEGEGVAWKGQPRLPL